MSGPPQNESTPKDSSQNGSEASNLADSLRRSVSRPFDSAMAAGNGPFGDRELFRFDDTRTRTSVLVHLAVLLIVAILAANVLVSFGTNALANWGITEDTTPVLFTASTSAFQFVGFLVVACWYLLWQSEKLVGLRVPTRSDVFAIVGGFVLIVGVMLSLEFLLEILGYQTAENVTIQRGRDHPELFLLLIPMQFLFTGPAEELLFRGVVQGLLRRAYGVLPGVIFAAIVFSLFHIPALVGGEGVVAVLSILFVSGALLGLLYEYTGNILVPIVVHAAWNALVFGYQYLQVVGI